MRSDGDVYTNELPGIPEPPKKRRNAAGRKRDAGYQGPKERARCETCMSYVIRINNPDGLAETETVRCGKYEFPVHRGGICRDWCAKVTRSK